MKIFAGNPSVSFPTSQAPSQSPGEVQGHKQNRAKKIDSQAIRDKAHLLAEQKAEKAMAKKGTKNMSKEAKVEMAEPTLPDVNGAVVSLQSPEKLKKVLSSAGFNFNPQERLVLEKILEKS